MNIGIDKIGFYSPAYYVDMADLATARNVDPNKYIIGLGQSRMAVAPITQDTITMGANAARKILSNEDLQTIDLVIFATETGVDQSKAGATVIHKMLGIQPRARAIEFKQACYSATAAIQLAKGHIALNPGKKALIVASDISRYGIKSGGEPTQGAGAVALLISEDPRILSIENTTSYYSDDVMDFWRPNYSDVAYVDGQFSNEQYQRFFKETYTDYLSTSERTLDDFAALTFHIPYTKIGLKTLRSVADSTVNTSLFTAFEHATYYNRRVGNVYSASLYLSLVSLFEKGSLVAGDRVGMYSYGSGAVAEFFSGIIQEGYQSALVDHETMISNRTRVDVKTYEAMFSTKLVHDGSHQVLDTSNETSDFYLKEIKGHIRYYNK